MPLKCAVQAISHICIHGAIQSVAEGTRVAASCAPSARDVTRGGHPPTLRMSPRPVLGGDAPVAPDAPAPHVLRARVVDRDRPAPLPVDTAWRRSYRYGRLTGAPVRRCCLCCYSASLLNKARSNMASNRQRTILSRNVFRHRAAPMMHQMNHRSGEHV